MRASTALFGSTVWGGGYRGSIGDIRFSLVDFSNHLWGLCQEMPMKSGFFIAQPTNVH
jgi:hypothetical protein